MARGHDGALCQPKPGNSDAIVRVRGGEERMLWLRYPGNHYNFIWWPRSNSGDPASQGLPFPRPRSPRNNGSDRAFDRVIASRYSLGGSEALPGYYQEAEGLFPRFKRGIGTFTVSPLTRDNLLARRRLFLKRPKGPRKSGTATRRG